MSEFLGSNDWQWRLARTIVQGVIGVLIVNVDLIVGCDVSKWLLVEGVEPMLYRPNVYKRKGVLEVDGCSSTDTSSTQRINRRISYTCSDAYGGVNKSYLFLTSSMDSKASLVSPRSMTSKPLRTALIAAPL